MSFFISKKIFITFFALCFLAFHLIAFDFLSSTYLGDESSDEGVFASKILSDGSIVVGAELGRNTKILENAESLLNQDSSQKIGVIFVIAPDGKTIKQKSIISSQIKDIAIDRDDNIYVAAGGNGVICLNPDAKKILWRALDGIYVHRIDVSEDGIVAILADLNEENPDAKSGPGTIYLFNNKGNQIIKFPGHSASDRNILDICIDSKSKSIITVGWRQSADWSEAANKGGPVQIALVRALDFKGQEKWTAYDWSTDGKSERYLNKPENNMADTRGLRCCIGEDGKLYVVFMCAGGNHIFRYNPFNINEKVEIPKGDPFNDFSATKSQHKTFFARYNPENGQYELGQQLTARSAPLKTNTLWCNQGEIYADKEGNVYLAGTSAYGLPIRPNKMLSKSAAQKTFNPFGASSYLGGPFLVINDAGMINRNFVTRISPYGGISRTVCAKTLKDGSKIIIWGGTVTLNGPAYTKEAIQPKPGFGENDAFFSVLSNAKTESVEETTLDSIELSIEAGLQKNVKIRNSSPELIDLSDDKNSNSKRIAFLYPWNEEIPLSPLSQELYKGTPLYGALYMEILNPDKARKNIHRNGINAPFKLEFGAKPKNENERLLFRAAFFMKTSDVESYKKGDKFSFDINSSLQINTSCPSLFTYPWVTEDGIKTWKIKFWMQTHFRWLVKDSGKFYLSKIMPEWKSHQDNTLMLSFKNDSEDGEWAEWTPSNDLKFDENAANFAKRDFSNIEAIGAWISDPDYRPTPESLAAGQNKPGGHAGIKLNSIYASLACNKDSISKPRVDFSLSEIFPVINQPIFFDASASLPGQGNINFIAWNFGDGSKSSGEKVNHIYLNTGPHYVQVTVWNDTLQSSVLQKKIEFFHTTDESEKKRTIAVFGGLFPSNTQMPKIIRNSNPLRTQIKDIDGDSVPDLELKVPFDDSTPFSTTSGTKIYAGWTAQSKMPLQKDKETHINNELTIDNFAKYKKRDTRGFYTIGYRTRREIPGRVQFIAMIFKDDFLNSFDSSEKKVALSDGSELCLGPFAEIPDGAKIRFVIREKGTYWVSDKFFSRPKNFKSDVNFESLPVFKVSITTAGKDQCKWAKFDPFSSLEITNNTAFVPENFTNLDGFGILSDSGYQTGTDAELQIYGFKLLSSSRTGN